MKKCLLTIIRGTPGSGKSTLAKKLAAKYHANHFENDQFLYKNGKYEWSPEAAKNAVSECFSAVYKSLTDGKDTIVSNVFVTKKSIGKYIQLAKILGIDYEILRLENDFGNIHNVPKATLASMKANFEDIPGEKILTYDAL